MIRRCGHCNGTGEVPLSDLFIKTLRLVRQASEATGADLARLDGCKATAMNMRLTQLEKMGFIVSRCCGRRRLYREARR